MDNDKVVVLSTGLEISHLCKASVSCQTVACDHIVILGGGTAAENRYRVISDLDPATIVCELDTDDWFPHPGVIDRVLHEYDKGAWMTWGQFRYNDYSPGWAAEWPEGTNPRDVSWFATHLKTYRAGLFQQIHPEDLRHRGAWGSLAIDNLIMFPLLEMSGPERGHFIPDVLYVYTGRGTDDASVAEARRIRAMPPYRRLAIQPW